MTYIIQKIEDLSALMGSYYTALGVCVAILSILVCFYSHRARGVMGYIVGVIGGSVLGLVTAAVVLVNSTNVVSRSVITLGIALVILYSIHKAKFIADAAMIFTPVALLSGFAFSQMTGSLGVGVFIGLVIGALITVVGVKVGRYFVICVNALVGAFVALLALLSGFGLLTKVYELGSLYIFIPALALAALGSAYQISINPERLAEKAAKIAAEEERKRLETAGETWPCTHCHTTNKKSVLYCRECGRTEKEPVKPVGQVMYDGANPGWRCSCGRINNLSKHRCECGTPIGAAEEWACSCGIRNGGTTDICTGCGQMRYQPYAKAYVPVEIPKVHAHHAKAH